MPAKRVHFQNLIKEIEEKFDEVHPQVLSNVRNSLYRFLMAIKESQKMLQKQISSIKEKSRITETLENCFDAVNAICARQVSYLDLESIQSLQDACKPYLVILTTVNGYDRVINAIKDALEDLKRVCTKHSQLLLHLQERFKSISQTIRRLQKEMVIIDFNGINETYCAQFNLLFAKHLQQIKPNTVQHDFGHLITTFKERKLLIKKIEILLEYPRFIAFEYSTDLKSDPEPVSSPLLKQPKHFRSIIANLNNPLFVENYLLKFPIEEVIQTIRLLHNHEKDKEENESNEPLVSLHYDEQIFLDLCLELQLAQRILKDSDYENSLKVFKEYRSTHNQEYNTLKDVGEKIFQFSLKVFRYQLFNKVFDEFREDMQKYFFTDFGEIIDIYY